MYVYVCMMVMYDLEYHHEYVYEYYSVYQIQFSLYPCTLFSTLTPYYPIYN